MSPSVGQDLPQLPPSAWQARESVRASKQRAAAPPHLRYSPQPLRRPVPPHIKPTIMHNHITDGERDRDRGIHHNSMQPSQLWRRGRHGTVASEVGGRVQTIISR